MIKTTTGIALQAIPALQSLLTAKDRKEDKPIRYSAKETFIMSRLLARIRADVDVLATDKAKIETAMKYGKEEGGMIRMTPDQNAQFVTEFLPIASTEIEIDSPLLPLSILEYDSFVPGEEMAALDSFWASE